MRAAPSRRVVALVLLAAAVAAVVGLLAGRRSDRTSMIREARTQAERTVRDAVAEADGGESIQPKDPEPASPATTTTEPKAKPAEPPSTVTVGSGAPGGAPKPTRPAAEQAQPTLATRDGTLAPGGPSGLISAPGDRTDDTTTPDVSASIRSWGRPIVISDPLVSVPGVDPDQLAAAFDGHDVVVGQALVLVAVDDNGAVVAVPVTNRMAQGFAPAPAVVALLGVLLAAFIAASGRQGTIGTANAVEGQDPGAALRQDVAGRSTREWEELVAGAVEVRDLVPSQALASRLGQALSSAGVVEVDPLGERFDPARHRATRAVATALPELVGTVAVTERVGYDAHGRHYRLPEVAVYQPESE